MLRQNKNLCIIISSESNLYVRIKNDMRIAYVHTYLQGRTENSGNYAFVYILKKGLMERMEFTCSSSSLILFLKRLRGGVWKLKTEREKRTGKYLSPSSHANFNSNPFMSLWTRNSGVTHGWLAWWKLVSLAKTKFCIWRKNILSFECKENLVGPKYLNQFAKFVSTK